MPHIHFIFARDKKDAPKNPAHHQKYINAQFPNPKKDEHLHQLVTEYMVHSKCQILSSRRCNNSKGKCTKGFPKTYSSKNVHRIDAYPECQRLLLKEGGFTGIKDGIVHDNRWVMPYIPGLLKALQCHVNLKAVTGVGCIKYIFKYIMKGPERASVKIRTQKKTGEIINEADIILDSRPVCSFESASKILGHKQQEIFPAVQRLPCILPEKEVIYW